MNSLPGLAYQFRQSKLLQTALTHRSFGKLNNERLEFLGDSVINMVVADLIYQNRPDVNEGDLSRLRARIVSGETLARIALQLDLGKHIVLGAGEQSSGGQRRESILADTLEAVIGAVYLDGGFAEAHRVIQSLCLQLIEALPDAEALKDAKTLLQEWLQAQGLSLPAYQLVEEQGQDHAKQFTVACSIEGLASDRFVGTASSLRKAEKMAASKALASLSGESQPVPDDG